MKRFIHILFVCLSSHFLFSQEVESIIQQRIEFLTEQYEDESIDLTDVIQILSERLSHPLNLNTAKKEELEELGLLTEIQVSDLLMHRQRFGKLITIYELQVLQFWNQTTIDLIAPFVRVDDRLDQLNVSFKEALKRGETTLLARYQRILNKQKGYSAENDSVLNASNTYYHGNPDRYYLRLRYSYRTNFSIGMTAEKDPGEQFFKGKQKFGFDFYSIHAFYKGGKYLRAIALGDYQVQIGQGLNLWSGYAFSKTSDAIQVKKSAIPLKPYTSSDETRFMRGAAVHGGYKNFNLLVFGSIKKMDGAIDSTQVQDSVFNYYSSSINVTGLHRTNSERFRKGSLTEFITGGSFFYQTRNLHIGLASVFWGYNKPFEKPIQPYNQYDFRGKNTTSFSADYSYVLRNILFFGEVSFVTHSKSWAMLQGILISMNARASLSFVYRNYQPGYSTFYNAAFAEGGGASNEKGIYTGLKVNISKSITLNSYFDYFEFPWLKYQVNKPSHGYEILAQINYKLSRNFELYGRFRQQLKEMNSRNNDGSVVELENVIQRSYRFNIAYKITPEITLKSRVEYNSIQRKSSKPEGGILFVQDLVYHPKKLPFDITLRYALFDTKSFDTRMYTYESNALYTFSTAAYMYQGSRIYALLQLKIKRKIDIWLRYGVFLYSNRKTIGTSGEEIQGNSKSDLTLQLRVKF